MIADLLVAQVSTAICTLLYFVGPTCYAAYRYMVQFELYINRKFTSITEMSYSSFIHNTIENAPLSNPARKKGPSDGCS